MLLGAAYRFLRLLIVAGAATTVVALLFGTLSGLSVDRSVSLGFYLVGSVVLIIGFFAGNRGPARLEGNPRETIGYFGSRVVRWATRDEQDEAINLSAVFVALGFSLIVLGVMIDGRHSLL